jgi:hypothetical protein
MNLQRLSDTERSQVEEVMRKASAEKPMVGIFWYNPNENELFGVAAVDPDILKDTPLKTTSRRHDQVWEKEHFRAVARHKIDSPFYSESNGYNFPQGRVFKNESVFYVMVGKWIDEYPQAKELIIEEFNLPSDVEFKYDPKNNIK